MQNKYLHIIGMMSGTSGDGIDVSLVKTNGHQLFSLKIIIFMNLVILLEIKF